jgi:hypothetical protein
MTTPDRKVAIKQINKHVQALKVDIEAAEVAGANLVYVKAARRLLDQAHAFLAWSIGMAPDGRTLEDYDKDPMGFNSGK